MVVRGRLEIRIEMLKVISKGATKPTLIMYKLRTSWKKNQELLKDLAERGLIEKRLLGKGKGRSYRITDAGHNNLKIGELLMEKILGKI